jgi:hypothetical protein
MQYVMTLMRLSDMELINELERKVLMKFQVDNTDDKWKYDNQIMLIENEMTRRMK